MNNSNGWGWLNFIMIEIIVFFIIGHICIFSGNTEDLEIFVTVAVLGDIFIAYMIFLFGKEKLSNTIEKIKLSHITRKKERENIVLAEIKNKISHKNKIKHTLDKHFDKIESQFSLVELISSCTENNNSQELENLLNSSKDNAFKSMRKEISSSLSVAEKKIFPKSIAEVVEYKKILDKEILELEKDLRYVDTTYDNSLFTIMKKHCKKMYISIKLKRIMIIIGIVLSVTIIVGLSIVLSSGYAFNKAEVYHQTVLENKLVENNLSSYTIQNIEYYTKREEYFKEEEKVIPVYFIKNITLRYDDFFYNHTENEMKEFLENLYQVLNVNIDYKWLHHYLKFQLYNGSKYWYDYDFEIVLIDKNDSECAYNGRYLRWIKGEH